MSLEIKHLVRTTRCAQYDGTNGAEIVAEFGGIVVSDDGTTLVFSNDPGTFLGEFTAEVGWWVLWQQESGPDAAMGASPDEPGWAPFTALSAPVLVSATGSEAVPASEPGGPQLVTVTLSPALSSAAYTPHVSLRGAPGVLAGHGITGVTVVDADTVEVTVQSAPLSLAGASVHVVAHEIA